MIGKQCFRGMDRLQNIQFLADGEDSSHLRVIGAEAFEDCRNLTEVQIPDSVVEIGNGAFQAAECLKSVRIGTGLSKLGAKVFAYDVSLKELYIASEHLEEVGKSLFTLNHQLSECFCPGDSAGAAELKTQLDRMHHDGGEEEKLIEEKTVTGTVRAEVDKVQDLQEAGDACGFLTDTVRYRLHSLNEEEYCLEITGTGAMPEWVSRENQPWRDKAGNIIEVQVGEGILSIGSFAFSGLTKLCSVRLSKTVEYVGIAAFGECDGLSELCFQEGMEALGCRALWGCANLKKLWLPKTFRVANLMATAYCPELKEVYFTGSKTLWRQNVIIDNMMERNQALTETRICFEEDEKDCGIQDERMAERCEQYQKEPGKGRKDFPSVRQYAARKKSAVICRKHIFRQIRRQWHRRLLGIQMSLVEGAC